MNIRSFYSIARLVNGGVQVTEPISNDTMLDHRERYGPRNRKKGAVGPWVSNFDAMGRKTAISENFKILLKTAEMIIAMEADE